MPPRLLPRFATLGRTLAVAFPLLALQAASPAASPPEAAPTALQKTLPKGISAWCYSQNNQSVFDAVRAYNAKVPADWRFNYFFPYSGSLEFDKAARKVHVYYGANNTKNGTPPGATPIPILDARAEKGIFSGWSEAEYMAAAAKAAEPILKDPLAKGAQVDIEPFSPDHLPFYRHLRAALNAKGKVLTLFVGPKRGEPMREIFRSCDVVVISGYDSSGHNPGPKKFRASLAQFLSGVQEAAEAAGGRYMVGIPAAAAWGEYEYSVDAGGANRKESGFKQEDYARAALEACAPFVKKPECLGVALWELSRTLDKDDPAGVKKPCNMPNHIRPTVWKVLVEAANARN